MDSRVAYLVIYFDLLNPQIPHNWNSSKNNLCPQGKHVEDLRGNLPVAYSCPVTSGAAQSAMSVGSISDNNPISKELSRVASQIGKARRMIANGLSEVKYYTPPNKRFPLS